MLAGKPVQIVDDDPDFLHGIEYLLKAAGLVVKAFSSAEDFRLQPLPVDAACLILDIHLGSASGIELMQEILQSQPAPPVVLITASSNQHMRVAAWAGGCSAFLQKPFPGKLLIDIIHRVTAENGRRLAAG